MNAASTFVDGLRRQYPSTGFTLHLLHGLIQAHSVAATVMVTARHALIGILAPHSLPGFGQDKRESQHYGQETFRHKAVQMSGRGKIGVCTILKHTLSKTLVARAFVQNRPRSAYALTYPCLIVHHQ